MRSTRQTLGSGVAAHDLFELLVLSRRELD
jgi:hypothetical protein